MPDNARMQPVAFKPHGPFALPYTRTKKVTTFDTDHLWSKGQAGPLAKGRGCYILAVKRGKTVLPVYVGLTRASFDREIFNPSNCRKYHVALKGGKKYALFVFILEHPVTKTGGSTQFIGELEDFFISAAFARNPELKNRKGIPRPKWQVPHVTAPAKGKPTSAARALREVMGFDGTSHHLFAGKAFKNRRKGI